MSDAIMPDKINTLLLNYQINASITCTHRDVHLSIGVVVLDFFQVKFLRINLVPAVNNICQHKRYQERYVEHGAQGKLTATAVGQRQR